MNADQSVVRELLRQLAEKEAQIIELQASLQAMEEFKGQNRQLESDLNPLPLPRLELRGLRLMTRWSGVTAWCIGTF